MCNFSALSPSWLLYTIFLYSFHCLLFSFARFLVIRIEFVLHQCQSLLLCIVLNYTDFFSIVCNLTRLFVFLLSESGTLTIYENSSIHLHWKSLPLFLFHSSDQFTDADLYKHQFVLRRHPSHRKKNQKYIIFTPSDLTTITITIKFDRICSHFKTVWQITLLAVSFSQTFTLFVVCTSYVLPFTYLLCVCILRPVRNSKYA